MPYIVLAFTTGGVIDLYVRRQRHFRDKVNTIFSICKVFGLLFTIFVVFNIGPAAILQQNVGPFFLNKVLFAITISIPISALFLPFILDYGLVDFFGVIMRPIMRPVFKLPGRAAVIAISAFLGNFSVGHLAVNDQYKEGRMTGRESAVIATSLSTVSIAFLIVLARATGIIEHWNTFFWSAFIITIIVTIIGIRIPPLRTLPDDYYPGVKESPEPVFKKDLMRNAMNVSLDVAEKSEMIHKRVYVLMRETALMLCTITTGAVFFGTVGILLNMYTPIFQWIGYIFYPFLWLIQIPGHELAIAAKGVSLSFLDATLPALLATGAEHSLRLKYFLAVLPVSTIIFIAAFIPCIMGTEIPVRFSQLCLIWLQRAILTILVAGAFAYFLFP
jgi:nucleoside recognition membrane protein YjiH